MKETLIKELCRVIEQIPWEERKAEAIARCSALVEQIFSDGAEAAPTITHINQLTQFVVPVVIGSAPEGFPHARKDLAKAAYAAINSAFAGRTVLPSHRKGHLVVVKAKAWLSSVRRLVLRA